MIQRYIEDNYDMFPFYITVERDSSTVLGPGILKVHHKDEVLDTFSVITGNQELDSAKYGGLTPPITWIPVELFSFRSPDGVRPSLTMSRIVPFSKMFSELFYPNRTYALPPERTDPFMIHLGSASPGSSTGCIVVTGKKEKFTEVMVEVQNQSCILPISVYDK